MCKRACSLSRRRWLPLPRVGTSYFQITRHLTCTRERLSPHAFRAPLQKDAAAIAFHMLRGRTVGASSPLWPRNGDLRRSLCYASSALYFTCCPIISPLLLYHALLSICPRISFQCVHTVCSCKRVYDARAPAATAFPLRRVRLSKEHALRVSSPHLSVSLFSLFSR